MKLRYWDDDFAHFSEVAGEGGVDGVFAVFLGVDSILVELIYGQSVGLDAFEKGWDDYGRGEVMGFLFFSKKKISKKNFLKKNFLTPKKIQFSQSNPKQS